MEDAAASEAVLVAVLVSLAVGAVLLVPSLVWVYVIFQTEERGNAATAETIGQRHEQ